MEKITTLLIFFLVAILPSCSPKKINTVHVVVREKPGEIINKKIDYAVSLPGSEVPVIKAQTNDLGYASIDVKELRKKYGEKDKLSEIFFTAYNGADPVIVKFNRFNEYYDIYLNPVKPSEERFADMHYHVSMKVHNSFGDQFYQMGNEQETPSNLAWFRNYKRLQVFDGKSWKKLRLNGNADDNQVINYINHDLVRAKNGANNLKHFSEATYPHFIEGNVYLAFNAISPFEYNISSDVIKRFISSKFKSGAPQNWLYMLGAYDKNNRYTHWGNFNKEYRMITSQDTTFNNGRWSYLGIDEDIDEELKHPLVINVVEGGHILQDKYFPHEVNFDFNDRTTPEYKKWRRKFFKENPELNSELSPPMMDELIDSLLFSELNHNINQLKRMDIFMIAIGHLSYNGMTGHSPALDVSKKPLLEAFVSYVVKRGYSLRVSSDKNYRKRYDGLFFTVPGVNRFGDTVITKLLDSANRRMHIDLKHSDPITRDFILDKYEEQGLEPICSHCGVNGISESYYSPMLNEYRLLNATSSRKFYPFSINLYNEEIERICSANGIIGIPLEERVLGAYVNNKIPWEHKISKGNDPEIDTFSSKYKYEKRWKHLHKALNYYEKKEDETYEKILNYYSQKAGLADIKNPKKRAKVIREIIRNDYESIEPFLQNVFQVVDIAYKVKKDEFLEETRKAALAEMIDTVSIIQYKKDTSIFKKNIDYIEYSQTISKHLNEALDSQLPIIRRQSWNNVCIGSDFDGLIDPLNVCPTASDYPEFKRKLALFIPMFIKIRHHFEKKDKFLGQYREQNSYFDSNFTIQNALDNLFYYNLEAYSKRNFTR